MNYILNNKFLLKKLISYLFYKFCRVNPKKIVFANTLTMQYSDNPKYIADEFLKHIDSKKYQLIWMVNKHTNCSLIPKEFKQVKYNSFRALYDFSTAKIWVINSHAHGPLKRGLIKKKETYYIQTWHGSMGIKKCDADAPHVYKKLGEQLLQDKSVSMFDFIPVDSDFEKQIYTTQHKGYAQIEKLGKARDSIFYKEHSEIIQKVKQYYNIPLENKILLYAPTWRADGRTHCFNIDIKLLKRVLKQRFGNDWSILIRAHYRMEEVYKILFDANETINASDYIDMQELLVAADVLISDYSSCLPEYTILKKPSFIYATDLNEYNTENGMYYPLSTLPCPIAQDNGELANNILNFDDKLYRQSAEEFLIKMGHKDDENSCARIVDFILDRMKK